MAINRPAPGTGRQWAFSIVATLVVVAAIGWWTLRGSDQRIDAATVSYSVVDDTEVTVSFDVTRPPGLPVTCTIEAMDVHFSVVGSADVVIPVGGVRTTHHESTVRTTSRAVTGVVQDCVRKAS
ncbi:DUF4307 domain-containing protein [Lapillicoccus sp.]|uniref:DUF4307 domain-containing protein n=1 Tax=Lapillicoccus sp. TaxID=1909287 RepID=UPI0025DF05D7|nr:DUF4307 domain-containing protein [Lapillicoccus sp.]